MRWWCLALIVTRSGCLVPHLLTFGRSLGKASSLRRVVVECVLYTVWRGVRLYRGTGRLGLFFYETDAPAWVYP